MLRDGILRLAILVASALLAQCRMAECNVALTDVNALSWSDEATVKYVNGDTTSLRDLDLVLHVDRSFESGELQLDISVATPDSLRYVERVTVPAVAQWRGNIRRTDIRMPYRRRVRFALEGKYSIGIKPVGEVRGVEAAGINFSNR